VSNVALVVFAVALGYLMLWRVRRTLGAAGIALASYPIGLLGITLVAGMHAVLGSRWNLFSLAVASLAVAAIVSAALGRIRSSAEKPLRVPVWTAALTAAIAATGAGIIAALQRFFVTADSWANYIPMGMRLHDAGAFFPRLMEERSPLIPAMNAAGRVFGADVLYAAYPVMGVWLVAILLWAVVGRSTDPAPRARWISAVAAAAGLALSAMFAVQSFYIHSHMVSALFLLFALACFAQAQRDASAIWAAVGGLATAGFALARPDGFAYAAMMLLIGVIATGRGEAWRKRVAPMFAGFWGPVAFIYGVAFAQLGLWDTAKLNGKLALVLLASLAVETVAAWVLLSALRTRRDSFLRRAPALAVGAATVVVSLAVLVRTDDFLAALKPMIGNLFRSGGHGVQWYVAAVVLLLAMVAPRLLKHAETDWLAPTMLVLFMGIAILVHGLTHPGHLGWTDSFNRIAFHATPLVWWAFGNLMACAMLESGGHHSHQG